MKAELKAHKHPQSRKKCDFKDMRKELLDHYYYIHENFDETVANISIQKKICLCQTDENETNDVTQFWIRCEIENCEKEWFHLKCLDDANIIYPSPENIETGKKTK